MNRAQLIEYCLTKPGAIHDYQADWGADRVCISGKMFALLGDLEGRLILSLKSDPGPGRLHLFDIVRFWPNGFSIFAQ